MSSAKRKLRSVKLALIAATLTVMSAGASAAEAADKTLPVDPLGMQWWQMYASIPNHIRSKIGETPAACALGQRGNTWYLSTSATGVEPVMRRCTVPKGSRLFLPLVTAVCVPFPGETVAQNIQICRELIDPFDTLVFTIDGKDSSSLVERRAQSKGFPLWFPEANIFDSDEDDVPAGLYVAVEEGQYALIEHLPTGHHTIHAYAASTASSDVPSFEYTYEINVVAPTGITPR